MAKKNAKYVARKAGVGAAIAGAGASIGAGLGKLATQVPQVSQSVAVPNVEGGAPTRVSHLVNAAQPVIDAAMNHGTATGAVIGSLGALGLAAYAYHGLRGDQFGK